MDGKTAESENSHQAGVACNGDRSETQGPRPRVFRIQMDLRLAHIDKSLLVYKVFYFLFYSSLGSVFPFLPGYFRQIGFSAGQLAALATVRSLIQLMFSPLCGILGDRLVSKKMAVQFMTFVWLIITISLAFIEPTNQICQLVLHNHTMAKVVNSTELKTGFFRRSIEPANIEGEPLLQTTYEVKEKAALRPVKKSIEDYQITEFGSASGSQGEETSGGSASFPASMKRPNLSKVSVTPPEKSPAPEHLNFTTNNILRGDSSQLHNIFMSALTLLAIAEVLAVPAFILIDACLLSKQTQENLLYYGQQRAFGSAGYIALFSIVGLLLNRSMTNLCGESYADFVICFCFFCVCAILTLLVGAKFEFPYKRPGSNPYERLKSVFYNRHYGSFLLAASFMGLVHTVICQYFNWLLLESKLALGTVGVINFFQLLGEPVGFLISGFLLKRVGTVNTIFGVLISLLLSLACCSFVISPWSVIPLGFIEEFICGLSWVACVTHLAKSAPVDCYGTVQGILRAVYHGLGTLCGTIIGGGLLALIGPASAFRLWAVLAILVLVAFTLGLRDLNSRDANYYTLLLSICSETKESSRTSCRPRDLMNAEDLAPIRRSEDRSQRNTPTEGGKTFGAGFRKSSEREGRNIKNSDDNSDTFDENNFKLFGL